MNMHHDRRASGTSVHDKYTAMSIIYKAHDLSQQNPQRAGDNEISTAEPWWHGNWETMTKCRKNCRTLKTALMYERMTITRWSENRCRLTHSTHQERHGNREQKTIPTISSLMTNVSHDCGFKAKNEGQANSLNKKQNKAQGATRRLWNGMQAALWHTLTIKLHRTAGPSGSTWESKLLTVLLLCEVYILIHLGLIQVHIKKHNDLT